MLFFNFNNEERNALKQILKENKKREILLNSLEGKAAKSRDTQLFSHRMISEKEYIRMNNSKQKALDIMCGQAIR